MIYEPEMLVVEKVFQMAADGLGQGAIQTRLYAENISTSRGGRVWSKQVIRRLVASDVYLPHSFEEIAELVIPETLARLDPDKEYGVQWYNRQKVVTETVSESDGEGGRRYKVRKTYAWRPKEEWIAIPVPAYLPRNLAERARAAMEANKGYERKHLAREWGLRSILRCSCGARMVTHTSNPEGRRIYHYYSCQKRRELRKKGPCRQQSLQARDVEPMVWDFVSDLLKDPERIRAGMDALMDRGREGGFQDASEEAAAWAKKLEECDRLRNAYQDQHAAGLMTLEELATKLKKLEETRRLAQAELAALEAREKRLSEIERDRDALLESWSERVPEDLERLRGEQRNKVYRMLRLEVAPTTEGYRITGAFCGLLCLVGPMSTGR